MLATKGKEIVVTVISGSRALSAQGRDGRLLASTAQTPAEKLPITGVATVPAEVGRKVRRSMAGL